MSAARSISSVNGESTKPGSPAVRAASGRRSPLPFPTFFPPPSTAEIRWVSFMGRRTQRPAFLPLSRRASAGSLLS
jgi:hypothetical protein